MRRRLRILVRILYVVRFRTFAFHTYPGRIDQTTTALFGVTLIAESAESAPMQHNRWIVFKFCCKSAQISWMDAARHSNSNYCRACYNASDGQKLRRNYFFTFLNFVSSQQIYEITSLDWSDMIFKQLRMLHNFNQWQVYCIIFFLILCWPGWNCT